MKNAHRILLVATVLAISCTPKTTMRSTTDPTSGTVDSRKSPELCSLERGRYCSPPSATTPTDVDSGASLKDEGWVCCAPAGTPCVAVSTYDECTFVGGWCYNYTVNEDDTVTCHD